MRDKYSYVPGPVPAGQTPAHPRMAAIHGWIGNFFAQQKTARKAAAATAVTQLQTGLQNARSTDAMVQAFRTYEATHLGIGDMSAQNMEAALKQSVRAVYTQTYPPTVWGPDKRVDLRLTNQVGQTWDVQIKVFEPPNAIPQFAILGKVYKDEARFEALALGNQPANRQNDVYIRRGFPNQHYIRYVRGGTPRYLRRYVLRGLNQEDSANITANANLLAPEQGNLGTANEVASAEYTGRHAQTRLGQQLTDAEQILSHTRGWKKRFISTTTTFRPAYSTRGEEFRSVFGAVIVDLAFVPGADIFDLHTPDALAELNTNANEIQTAQHQANPAQRNLHDEEILGGRDVVRTREVLIRFRVPIGAIRSAAVGQTVIGVWHNGNDPDGRATFGAVETAWTPAHPWVAREELSYRRNYRWYAFYQFAGAAAANNAWLAMPNTPPANLQAHLEHFTEYTFPAPLPLGFTR